MNQASKTLLHAAARQWVLLLSALGLAATSLWARRFPHFSADEFEVAFVLFALFVTIEGMKRAGAIRALAAVLRRGSRLPLKLVLASFVLSMFVTNDVALVALVPLTLAVNLPNAGTVVILEALAANAGSALTPVGNPQNLFLYWTFRLSPGQFVGSMLPFSGVLLVALVVATLLLAGSDGPRGEEFSSARRIERRGLVHVGLAVVVALTVLRVLPVGWCVVVVAYAALADRRALRVDYPLLATFVLLFGMADNLVFLLSTRLGHASHVFVLSALTSQVVGNVPTALIFANFTHDWRALLWGTNAGGFGTLFASMANLIAYQQFVRQAEPREQRRFTRDFFVYGFVALLLSFGLYYAVSG